MCIIKRNKCFITCQKATYVANISELMSFAEMQNECAQLKCYLDENQSKFNLAETSLNNSLKGDSDENCLKFNLAETSLNNSSRV